MSHRCAIVNCLFKMSLEFFKKEPSTRMENAIESNLAAVEILINLLIKLQTRN